MNEKFFHLSQDKQERIINSAYHVFAINSYKKASAQAIAERAGISKSLLFFYFRNKKELYLYLWKQVAAMGSQMTNLNIDSDYINLFEFFRSAARNKYFFMHEHSDMTRFVLRAFFEKDPEVNGDIQLDYHELMQVSLNQVVKRLNPSDFIPGLDLAMMMQEIYWSSLGYLLDKMGTQGALPVEVNADFDRLIDYWQNLYLRKEGR